MADKDIVKNDEEKRPKKKVIFFNKEEMLVPVWAILTVEKSEGYIVDHLSNWIPIFYIYINKGMQQSQECIIGEKTLTYENIEARDRDFKAILDIMGENFYDIVTI